MAPARMESPFRDARELQTALRDAGSIRSLARDLNVAHNTVRRWISDLGVSAVDATAPRVDYHGLVPDGEEWSGPRATLEAPSTNEETERVVIIGDFHAPFHDKHAVAGALDLIEHLDPHAVVINGDVADFFGISSHNRTLERLDRLQDEVDTANAIRRAVRAAAPNAVIHENEGNHDSRLRTFVRQRARELSSLDALKPERLNAWDELEIKPHGTAGFLVRPNLIIKHGNLVRSEAGASARAELKRTGLSGISGHTHRLAKTTEDNYASREWHEGGCLCQLDPDYVAMPPNWRHGACVAYLSTSSPAYVVEHVQSYDGHLFYGGRFYGAANYIGATA